MSNSAVFRPWPTSSKRGFFAPGDGQLPAEPNWPKLKCRVLVPFLFREEFRSGGRVLPLGPARVLTVGEVIEAITPDAKCWEALGRVDIVVD